MKAALVQSGLYGERNARRPEYQQANRASRARGKQECNNIRYSVLQWEGASRQEGANRKSQDWDWDTGGGLWRAGRRQGHCRPSSSCHLFRSWLAAAVAGRVPGPTPHGAPQAIHNPPQPSSNAKPSENVGSDRVHRQPSRYQFLQCRPSSLKASGHLPAPPEAQASVQLAHPRVQRQNLCLFMRATEREARGFSATLTDWTIRLEKTGRHRCDW